MTGPVAFSSTAWETEPSSSPRKPPMPREPVRTSDAPRSWTSAEIVRQTGVDPDAIAVRHGIYSPP